MAGALGTVCILLAPTSALAIDYHLCISPNEAPLNEGCGLPCDNASLGLSTIGDDVENMVPLLPDLADGNRPWVSLCVQGPGVLNHPVQIHNENGQTASPLFMTFDEVDFCPTPFPIAPGIAPPVVLWNGASTPIEGQPPDRLTIHIDLSPIGDCSWRGAGIVVQGGGVLEISETVVRGAHGLGIGGVEGEVPTQLLLTDTHVLNTEGAALQNWADVTLRRSEVTGSYLAASDESPAVLGVYGDGSQLRLSSTVLFGNFVEDRGDTGSEGSGAAEALAERPALVSGHLARLDRVVAAANVLGSNAVLFHVALPGEQRLLQDDSSIALESGPWMSNSVLSRNIRLDSANQPWPFSAATMEPWPIPNWPETGTVSCAGLDPDHAYFYRNPGSDSVNTANGPLIEFVTAMGQPTAPGITLQRNFLVGNKVGSGPLLLVDGAAEDLRIQLLHNTIADNNGAGLLELVAAQPDARVTVLKNLFAASDGDSPPSPLLVADAPIRSLVSSMNASSVDGLWSVTGDQAETILNGPHPYFSVPDFHPACDLQELSDCERYQQICPSAITTDCSDQPWTDLPCALDEAAAWIPTPKLLAQLGGPWPWKTDFYTSPESGAAAAGATGGACEPLRATFDSLNIDGGSWGDGDGYPDAVDCANDDEELGPVPPTYDGYSTWFCIESDSHCYECPEGTEPPILNDFEAEVEEAEPEPDEMAADESDTSASDQLVDSGCTSGGLGVSYSCDDARPSAALALLMLPYGWRRRPRSVSMKPRR